MDDLEKAAAAISLHDEDSAPYFNAAHQSQESVNSIEFLKQKKTVSNSVFLCRDRTAPADVVDDSDDEPSDADTVDSRFGGYRSSDYPSADEGSPYETTDDDDEPGIKAGADDEPGIKAGADDEPGITAGADDEPGITAGADAGPGVKAGAEADLVKAAKTNLRRRMYPYYVERRRLLEKNGKLSKTNAYDIARDFLKANPEVKNDIPLNDKELLDWIYSSVGQRYNREKKKNEAAAEKSAAK